MSRTAKFFYCVSMFTLFSSQAFSLPADWKGGVGFGSSYLNNYTMSKDISQVAARDSQAINFTPDKNKNASYQDYVLKLSPSIIVNDSATFFAELSTNYDHGGIWGEDSGQRMKPALGNTFYFMNTSMGNVPLSVRKFYVELYADTATFVIGRQASHWGLGAVYNSGEKFWDQYATIRDGVAAKFKIGNFNATPYWYRISQGAVLTKGPKVQEMGFSILYDNVARDMSFGVLYSQKDLNTSSNFMTADISVANTGARALSGSNVKVTDLFLKKSFKRFNVGIEVPLVSGSLNNVLAADTLTTYKANAVLVETNYSFGDTWLMGLDGGIVSGDNGNASNFDAMYLNPNFQIANLLFHYNMNAISDAADNIHDNSITNTKYLKLRGKYVADKWTFDGAAIYALASEVARANQECFNHTSNARFNAKFDQSDKLGVELDGGFKYQWNSNVDVSGNAGYLFAGNYFAFNNTATPINLVNPWTVQLRTAIVF